MDLLEAYIDGWRRHDNAAVLDTLTDNCGAFDGATVARLDQGRIAYLREYATTAPLYDWTGAWRD